MKQLLLALSLLVPAALAQACPSLLDHRYTSLQGKPVDLCDYANRPILVIEKGSVTGQGANPFFRQLAATTGESPRWNFHKYLIAPDGKTVYSFRTQVEPDSREIMGKLLPMLT